MQSLTDRTSLQIIENWIKNCSISKNDAKRACQCLSDEYKKTGIISGDTVEKLIKNRVKYDNRTVSFLEFLVLFNCKKLVNLIMQKINMNIIPLFPYDKKYKSLSSTLYDLFNMLGNINDLLPHTKSSIINFIKEEGIAKVGSNIHSYELLKHKELNELFKEIIRKKEDLTDGFIYDSLTSAAIRYRNIEILDFLLNHIDRHDDVFDMTVEELIMDAITTGDLHLLKFIIRKLKIDPKIIATFGESALDEAIQSCSLNMIKYIIKNVEDLDITSEYVKDTAKRCNDPSILSFLLDNCVDKIIIQELIKLSISGRNLNTVKFLVENKNIKIDNDILQHANHIGDNSIFNYLQSKFDEQN